ncbi:MAG: type II toxin-antitoxin system HicB family antitoxin [Candidatus Taylorbacteria bacterium]
MKTVRLKNVVWKEGKFYVAQCLNVDISSFGKTRKEALANIKEAIELYFEDIKTPSIPEVTSLSLAETSFQHA